jgi:hypothetical protein
VGEDVDAAQHLVARIGREFYFLGSHFAIPIQRDYWVIIRGSRVFRWRLGMTMRP